MQPLYYDVAIVGAGPTGTVLANLLGQAGLSVVIFDRSPDVIQVPRAMHFDGESMRIFQSIGLADAIAERARPAPLGTRYMTPDGQTLLIRKSSDAPGPHGWFVSWHFHQPELERVLRDGLARFPNVELKVSHEVEAVEGSKDGAVLRVHDQVSDQKFDVKAGYVVGCDGARSIVRRTIGSNAEDLGLHQPWLVVDMAVDPASPRVAALPEYALQLCDPKRPISVLYVNGNRRRWEIMMMPGDDAERMVEPDRFWPMLERWVQPEDGAIERSAVYTFHALIASPWRRDTLLLAGDSCHQTPPFLGQGMCAGLRDAANLAWKLVMVVQRKAAASLLDSYESERRPHVRTFIELSVKLGGILQTTDPAAAEKRNRQFAEGNTEIFEFPNPALGSGAWDKISPGAGQIFPQPRLADGSLLDDVVGRRFVVIGSGKMLEAIDDSARAIWNALDMAILADPTGALAEIIEEQGAEAIILRPDSYLFGIASDAEELSALTRRLANSLQLACLQPAAME